jgi:hypothetical protein
MRHGLLLFPDKSEVAFRNKTYRPEECGDHLKPDRVFHLGSRVHELSGLIASSQAFARVIVTKIRFGAG